MAHKHLALRARPLSDYCYFSLVLIFWLAPWPVAAQDRDQDRDRTAARQAIAEGDRLLKEETGQSWLRAVDKYQEALALQRALGDRSGEVSTITRVAVLADPVFDRSDERIKASFAASSAAPSASSFAKALTKPSAAVETREAEPENDLARSVKDVGGASQGFHLSRLPFTRKEAQAILSLAPKSERLVALDFAASQGTVFNQELSQYRYVHFATHGLLNSLRPELSGIVLSLVNERGELQDGFLRAHEVFDLDLPVELVVLSACVTGLGKEIKGEGLVGLTRGFMYAGAARVMVSLWDVNDQATAQLMAN